MTINGTNVFAYGRTFRVHHVYCNFIRGCMCLITVIFGTLEDESLLINIVALNYWRNVFQNGVDALSKN